MLKAVIFDLDNTLYSYDDAHAVAWRAVTDCAGRELGLSPERFAALHERASAELERRCGKCAAVHNRLLRYQVLLEQAGLPFARASGLAKLYWTTFIDAARAYPDAADTLRRLREMGLAIGIGTNMTADWQYEKLERMGLMPCVDFIVTSEEVSAEKPDARFFTACAEKAGCTAGECLFVGDSLNGDVLGALGAGMPAAWLRLKGDAEPPEGATVLASLGELPDIISTKQPEGA